MQSLDPIPGPEAASPAETATSIEATTPIMADGTPPLPVHDPTKSVVDIVDVLLITLMTASSFVFIGGAAAVIFMFAHRSEHLSSKAMGDALAGNAFFVVPTQLVVYLAILGFMSFLVWARHRTLLFPAILWNAPNRIVALIALAAGTGLALFSDLGEFALHPWIPKSLPITDYFKDRPSALLLAAFGILIAPLMEEILFRGFLYPALARWTGAVVSILLTASAFTLLHGAQLGYSWAPLLLIFVVGVVLTVTRAVTKSVATCVLVHMSYNFVLLAQSYYATQGFRQLQGS